MAGRQALKLLPAQDLDPQVSVVSAILYKSVTSGGRKTFSVKQEKTSPNKSNFSKVYDALLMRVCFEI